MNTPNNDTYAAARDAATALSGLETLEHALQALYHTIGLTLTQQRGKLEGAASDRFTREQWISEDAARHYDNIRLILRAWAPEEDTSGGNDK